MVVLDLGCGVGRWSFALAPFVKRVVGADVSPKMISLARKLKLAKGKKAGNINFVRARVEKLPFPGDSFDLITSVTVLQHVRENSISRAVGEITRVCKLGGFICILESTSEKSRSAYLHPRSAQEWKALFEKRGCRLVRQRQVSLFPFHALFSVPSSIASKIGAKEKKHGKKAGKIMLLREFYKIFKTVVLWVSLPFDLRASGLRLAGSDYFGDQKVMVFRKKHSGKSE